MTFPHCNTILQIGGPPGSGKTQFCMTVGASALEIGVTVAYIDTEGAFTGDRLGNEFYFFIVYYVFKTYG